MAKSKFWTLKQSLDLFDKFVNLIELINQARTLNQTKSLIFQSSLEIEIALNKNDRLLEKSASF